MVVEPGQRERELAREPSGVSAAALDAFAAASLRLAEGSTLNEALAAIAEAAANATAADVVVVRVADPAGDCLTARAGSIASSALAAELEGSRFPLTELGRDEVDDPARLPEAVRRAAERARAAAVLQIPLHRDEQPLGSMELALAVLADCRSFGGGELADDCTIVVLKRTG